MKLLVRWDGCRRPFHRHSNSVSVISFIAVRDPCRNLKSLCYSALIRSLSNQLVCFVQDGCSRRLPEVYFSTPECGYYHIPYDPERIHRCIMPIAGAHFAIGNLFSSDLPREFRQSSPVVERIKHYGKELDRLGVLPAPFPLQRLLSEKLRRRIYKLYGVTGLSYGNLSARESIPELGSATFWMTGRGVNKANIQGPGRDIFLVKGLDRVRKTVLVSVPPHYNVRARVSVDAVEHALIYKTFPAVGAIIHVHAWMEGVINTQQNYPCGTIELAEEVVKMLYRCSNPSEAAVGLKNHGLTITGHSLDHIFDLCSFD